MSRVIVSAALAIFVILAGCSRNSGENAVRVAPSVEVRTPVGQASYVIRKSPGEVFEALVNPDITTKFWFVSGSERLGPGKRVRWEFPGISSTVVVREFQPDRRLVLEWGPEGKSPTKLEFRLKPEGEGATRLDVIHTGFEGDAESQQRQARDSTGGFTRVLAGLKLFVEQGLQLNLVGDTLACRDATQAQANPVREAPVGQVELLIRKPVAQVFEAVVDPAVTTKFWFLEGSERLGPGKEVRWLFPGNTRAHVAVRTFELNRRLVMEWWAHGHRPQRMEWVFRPSSGDTTCLSVTSSGFVGDTVSIADQANYMTGGFTFVLTSMKAFLEHGQRLNHADYSERVEG